MKNSAVAQAIRSSVDPERAKHFFDLLSETDARAKLEKISSEQANLLASLFSGSQALGNALMAHPDWLSHLEAEHLRFPRRAQGLRHEVRSWLPGLLENKDYAMALGQLREFKQREMLRIAARDLSRPGNVPEITREISDIADVCLDAVWQICHRQLVERFGEPWHQDAEGEWQHTEFCVLGMGKLGGQELNYSSDVDVLFVYSEEGQVFKNFSPGRGTGRRDAGAPRVAMSNHQFFTRLAEAFIAEVSRAAPEGMLYRIDLRLRPEGDAGPLCRSLGSYENYYAQWGQTWERMMLIKARLVAGDKNLAGEFFETIQSFRHPRSIQENVLHEIGAMKDRIENEVVRADELERNVKLGRGGIREVEFIAQSQQLLHAGKLPFLQGAQTLPTLEKLEQYHLLSGEESRALRDAYCFLRDVEHRLQMEENLQTHTIPTGRAARERLAKLMQFKSAAAFEAARREHTDRVRAIFNKLFKTEKSAAPEENLPREFSGAEAEWEKLLTEHSFREPDKMVPLLREFVEGPGYVHVSSRTIELARRLLPRLLAMCPQQRRTGVPPVSLLKKRNGETNGDRQDARPTLSDPDRVVTRLDSFIAAYGARSMLFELWNSNPAIFDLLVLLFDRSEFLAELAIRTPDMVDVLVTSGRLRRSKTSEAALSDLRHGLADADQKLWLRRYHQAELMRIGLRDILGLADPEQYLTELSALADACLQYAVEAVMRRHKLKTPPFVIVGLGKLGGAEIDYGSDLDIIFVADAPAKNLPKLGRLALEVMDLISARTELGIVFHTDARLRPDGEKGLLVNTLAAYEEYYRERAQPWEIQSLTRTRPVAGDLKVGGRFQKMANRLTDFSKRGEAPGAFETNWKNKIHQMRMRIETERTPAGKDDLAIKTGRGGLVDAEFIAQALCLENGWHEANTLRALERGRAAGVLAGVEKLVENYRQLRRVEGILRRWSYEGEIVLPDEPEPFYRVSIRCGFATSEEFRAALAQWRSAIREMYEGFFGSIAKTSV
jgi:[glutamine synthetase] adenylyltransferase / [glutamine synthetase]-adenylyl-L-tyrosine phosphorylase